jgi:hypothetical protein
VAGSGLRLYDVSDPSMPIALAYDGYDLNAVDVEGQFAYAAAGVMGVFAFEVSDSLVTTIDQLPTLGSPQGVLVKDHLVYVADGPGGVLIGSKRSAALGPVWIEWFTGSGARWDDALCRRRGGRTLDP